MTGELSSKKVAPCRCRNCILTVQLVETVPLKQQQGRSCRAVPQNVQSNRQCYLNAPCVCQIQVLDAEPVWMLLLELVQV